MNVPLIEPLPAEGGATTDVRLLGLATALPPHVLPQDQVVERARDLLAPRYAQFERIVTAFENAGIDKRHSVVPFDWFGDSHGWKSRNDAFLAGAVALFRDAAGRALAAAGLQADQIDAIVTVSSTGVATPTLEAVAALEMGFRPDVLRVPVFGLGCAGGVSGLSIARELAVARPGSRVLMVAVETCTLLFRMDRMDKADIIATALFGDGAAAVVLGSADGTSSGSGDAPRIGRGLQHMWPDTLNIMGWDVDDIGLGVIFDRSIPAFATERLGAAFDGMRDDLGPVPVTRMVCHPGGAKVVTAIETALALPAGALDVEREVLRDAGNMSAPTVLFVLERVLQRQPRGRLLLSALGPGFTLSLLPLDV
ncbi:type III polyketide synthase [uncultured Paracoccus sp.]|uniref:type III polyketide synthase n=1 Tax=uncultured Paracoccus sp. TaxID=189685 RepID=UPI00261202AE|nr:type III polyketide synthase [uncultured Paracoccus sp.]